MFESMGESGVQGPVDPAAVVALRATVGSLCRALDPNTIGLADVSGVFDDLVAMGKLVDGAITRLSARYEEAGRWKQHGAKSAADDIARRTGTGVGAAKKKLETSKRLKRLPKTDNAVREGELSDEQADAISGGADASPDDEDDLLDAAHKQPLHDLRRRAGDARGKADRDDTARRKRQHQLRRLSTWNDEDGMYNLRLTVVPEKGAEIDAALAPLIDQHFADARNAGRFEPRERYAADAVADALTGASGGAARPTDGTLRPTEGPPTEDLAPRAKAPAARPDRKVIATIDLAALNRGHLEGEETCDIAGVGPVPVSVVRSMLSDAFLALVIKDGVDVLNVTHLGRQVTAHQRTALEARGYRCEVEGCGSTHHLQLDHNLGWALTQTTELDDMSWLCGHDHDRKTRENLILVGPVGRRRLVPRTGPPPPEPTTPKSDSPPNLFTAAT